MKKNQPLTKFSYLVIFILLFSCSANEHLDQQLLNDEKSLIITVDPECEKEIIKVVAIYNTKNPQWRESPEEVKEMFRAEMQKYFSILRITKTECEDVEIWEVNCEEYSKHDNTNEEDEAEAEIKRIEDYIDEDGCLKR